MSSKESLIRKLSFEYALDIIKTYKFLTENRKEFILSKQLLRSGTSVGANVREAQNAQSIADFIHKLSISQKECDESIYWLELLNQSNFISDSQFVILTDKAISLLKMIKRAIITSKAKSKTN